MNLEKLKEVLLKIVENQETIKEAVNSHEHDNDGNATKRNPIQSEWEEVYEDIRVDTIQEIFEKPEKAKKR